MCLFVHQFYLVVQLRLGRIGAFLKISFATITHALSLLRFAVFFCFDVILRNGGVGCWKTYCIRPFLDIGKMLRWHNQLLLS